MRPTPRATLLLLGASALGLMACDDVILADGLPETITCSSCHGTEANAAPPLALDGSTDTATLGVGAHQAHLVGGGVAGPIACGECHIVPAEIDAPGHVDSLPAEVTWGERATLAGTEPEWDREQATCSNVYCHGATLAGGQDTAPVWTQVDGSQVACDSCHGNPPPAPHPNNTDCALCHSETVAGDGSILVSAGTHIDGTVQALLNDCGACHGTPGGSPAPPPALDGSTDTSNIAVGAHAAHLSAGAVAGAVACDECHIVPTETGDEGHLGELPAEITWGALASADGALTPEWDRVAETCSNVYCHGATLSGGSATAPKWTQVDGSQAGCASCHGFAPPAPHPQEIDCARCHSGTVGDDGNIDVAGGLHLDGVIQTDCNACHGGDANAAPPQALDGATETSDIGVGAHQAHLTDGDLRLALDCADCHEVPTSVSDPGHQDNGVAEMVWSALATHDGELTPIWDPVEATCSNVYCHGATLGGGNVTEPIWTLVDGSQSACGACHSTPPPPSHPDNANCSMCHTKTLNADGTIDTDGGAHINGAVDF